MTSQAESTFKDAFEVIKQIESGGGEAFVVGGSVRDYLSGRPVGDIDIATSEPPVKIQQLFDKVIPIGIEHGTVIVRYQSVSYEVTTYRMESGYQDYRHPDEVTFVQDIRKDLARRDFTINAMAMDRQGGIIDPYGGQQAIKERRIKAVGDAVVRFQEDPLRMMRAARFISQLEFELDEGTELAMTDCARLLEHIAIERIAVETEKLFAGKGYKEALRLLMKTGLIQYLPSCDVWRRNKLPEVPLQSWSEILAFYANQSPEHFVREWVRQWKLSNKTKAQALDLVKALQLYQAQNGWSKWLVYRLPVQLYESFSQLLASLGGDGKEIERQMIALDRDLPIQSRSDLAFQAQDLLELFPEVKKGPWISQAIDRIEFDVVESRIANDYEKIKEWVKQWNPPGNS